MTPEQLEAIKGIKQEIEDSFAAAVDELEDRVGDPDSSVLKMAAIAVMDEMRRLRNITSPLFGILLRDKS